jgi:uroporphyrinogen decarboxylase
MLFEPDYRNIVDAARNKRPARLPLYEHKINVLFMEKALGKPFAINVDLIDKPQKGNDSDLCEFFRQYCEFFRQMTYDTVSFEFNITRILPDAGALLKGGAGPIQNRSDFDNYPWDELPERYWQVADKLFDILAQSLPEGMKAVGGIGNGVFELTQDLVGFEYLRYMLADDPKLFADLHRKIGDLMFSLWSRFLQKYSRYFVLCRFGDDLGFKTGTLIPPQTIISYIIPQYRRVIQLVHKAGLPFLLHSCGCIFDVMKPIIEAGIDAKHSNEDAVAPYETWIKNYGGKIGLFGGIDVDRLCQSKPDEIYQYVMDAGTRFRKQAKGYALGSGNSIPAYIPVEGYTAMIRAAQKIREIEARFL